MQAIRRRSELADYEFSVASAHARDRSTSSGRLFAGCRTERVGPSADPTSSGPRVEATERTSSSSCGARVVARGPVDSAIDRLIWETSTRAFASGDFLFVHAGVASLDGRSGLASRSAGSRQVDHGRRAGACGIRLPER